MKIVITKTNSNVNFYICHSFINKDGKSTSKTHKRLGTLNELSKTLNLDQDGVILWAKEQARIATGMYNKENESISIFFSPTISINKDTQRSFNSGYLFLQSIYSDLRFDNIFRNIKARHDCEYNLDSILSDLIYSRILKPSSKISSYLFAQSLVEQPKYQLHDL